MDSKDMDHSAAEASTNTTSISRSKRGKICLTKVAQRRAKGVVQHVDFNALGQPVGEAAAEMQSYIGLLTRDHVKINIKNWREVPQDVKELIWETVKSSYKVPEQWKAGCMESASSKWRTWKTRMYNDFIVPNKDDASKLYEPPLGSGILPIDCNQFVISRMSSEFKTFSEQQKERRSKNMYPHRLSRKGYARFAEEIKKSELKGDVEIDRAVLWKKARVNKDGEIENENLKIAIQKIDDYIREKEEGLNDSSSCSSDLLSRALEKPEHGGRVRALGAGVKPKSFFETPRERRQEIDEKSQAELEDAKKQIKEQDGRIHVLDKVIYELVSRIGKLEAKVGEKDEKSEGLGSCSVIKPQKKQVEDDEDIKLVEKSVVLQGKVVKLLVNGSKKVVAYGTVVVAGDVLHGSPMPENCLRVAIDEVVDKNALLPFRISDEMETVGSALGTHVAWPSHLVVERSYETHDKKTVGKKVFKESAVKNLSSMPSSLVTLYYVTEKSFTDVGIHVTIDIEVFGQDISVWILKEDDVIPFCNLEPITGNCIIIYIWNLYGIMKKNGTLGKFMFVNPFSISYARNFSAEARACILSDRLLQATSNQLVFVPCNVGEHWILTIFELEKDRVYLMDPLTHRNRDTTWKSFVDTAMSIVNVKKGKKFKKSANWEVVKGTMQPDHKQCGYFVMKFMKDVITSFENDASTSLSSMFKNVKTYSQAEVDDVREEWATCVIKHVFD